MDATQDKHDSDLPALTNEGSVGSAVSDPTANDSEVAVDLVNKQSDLPDELIGLPLPTQQHGIPSTDQPKLFTQVNTTLGTILLLIASVAGIIGSIAIEVGRQTDNTSFPLAGWLLPLSAIAVLMLLFGEQQGRIKDEPMMAAKLRVLVWTVWTRFGLSILAVVFSVLAYIGTELYDATLMRFTLWGVVCWVLAVLFSGMALTGTSTLALSRSVAAWFSSLRRIRWTWVTTVMAIILLIGGALYFGNTSKYPPDPDSDHWEDLQEVLSIVNDGQTPVYMHRAYGREPGHFYVAALLHGLTGHDLDFDLIKFTSAVEGFMVILVAFWMGRALFYEEDRQFGIIVGLLAGLFIATGWWPLNISRFGLRAISMTAIVGITCLYMARAIRHQRLTHYALAGAAAGVTLYTYTSTRVIPLLLVFGWILGVAYGVRSWRQFRTAARGGLVMVVMFAIVAMPIINFAVRFPDAYWARSLNRLSGDTTQTDSRLQVIIAGIPTFLDNLRKTALAMNWRGDQTWAFGTDQAVPMLDPVVGGLFVLGLAILIYRVYYRRDPVDLFLIGALVVMLLPTALSLQVTVEVPSGSRMAGAIALIFLIAAIGAATILRSIMARLGNRFVRYGLWAMCWLLLGISIKSNFDTYFTTVYNNQRAGTWPYNNAAFYFRDFVSRSKAPGNVAVLYNDLFWDSRLLAVGAGEHKWDIVTLTKEFKQTYIARLQFFNDDPRYAFRPNQNVLFFYNGDDATAAALLLKLFPNARNIEVTTPGSARAFYVYEAPPPGCEWFKEHSPDWQPLACTQEETNKSN